MSDQPNDIEAVFVDALGKTTPEERAAYLDEACRGDAEARSRVEALLEAHDDAGSFLEKPAAEFVPTGATADTSAHSADTSADKNGGLDFLLPTEKPECLGIIGQYEVTEVVGRGGMGIVLKGHDPKLNRVVAVKVLAPELASNASACKRFLREGRAAAAVSHDHVVTIYGIDDSGRLPFIAMEYVSGPSLEDRIKSEGSLEPTEILRIGMQIASGLAAAHAQGLVHRDVKPANILLENGVEKVKITDFGLARAVDDVRMTKPGVVTGTPEYMSPEQARGESVDHRTDLFSLGSVLYAMCTGRSPFRAENTVAMIRRVCEDTPRPIQDVNPDIPGWLVQIIDDLLAKSAADRFQSASELAELLGQCLAHLQEPSINPLPDGLEGRKVSRWRATTRRRGWLTAAAVLLLMLGGLSLTEATGVTNMAATVIRIVRGDGTLVIEVDDPEVSVSIDGQQLVITGAGAKEIRLTVGQHELKAVKDGKPVHTESVTITRDGRQVVRVDVKPKSPDETAETPDTEATAEIQLQESWLFAGLDDLDVLAISRDGRYCAFTEPLTGGLLVRDLTTGKDQRVGEEAPSTGSRWDAPWASISPDNKWVAYKASNANEGRDLLRIAGIDGSQQRVPYPNEEKSRIELRGWSPDSQHVLMTFFDSGGEKVSVNEVPARIATVAIADGSTKVLKVLAPEEHDWYPLPQFSPDGRYVAFARMMGTASGLNDIVLIPLAGGPEIPLVEGPADEWQLGWLPDGKSLLFQSDRRGKGDDVWMIQVEDGKPVGLPRLVKKGPLAPLQGPVRTPTGGWAFYYRELGESKVVTDVHLGAVDPDTGKLLTAPIPVSQPTAGRERAMYADFSHDGKYLAYYVAPAPEQSPEGLRYGPGNIVIRTLETAQEREITLSPELSTRGPFLRWAADGRSIFVHGSVETGRYGIYRVDTETGKLDPFMLDAPELAMTDWRSHPLGRRKGDGIAYGELSSDGKTLFLIRGRLDPNAPSGRRHTRLRVVARDLETGQEREIYRNPDGVFDLLLFAVSPDGERVFVASKTMLRIFPTAAGEPRELLKVEKESSPLFGWTSRTPWTFAWTADSRYLLFVKVDQGKSELWRISAEGGEPERLDELPGHVGASIMSLRIRPDGRQIAFHAAREQYQIRMMQIVVSDELAKEMCTENLRKIGEAIKQYKNDPGDVPDGFADLYPDYLQDSSVLLCPADHSGGQPLAGAKDPKMRCSYRYMFGPRTQGVSGLNVALPVDFPAREAMTWKEARKLQLEYFGPVVPVVQCRHHNPRLSLRYDGEIIEARSWVSSSPAEAGLLSQLKSAMESEPATWAQRYDMQRFHCLLRDEDALAKLLETHVEEHPEDKAAREFLAELPKLRFTAGAEDDAEENVGDGAVHLWSDDLELIHDADPGHNVDQVVGIRFRHIPVPHGARIKRAYIQLTAYPEDAASQKTDLVVHAELAADAKPFAEVKHNITSRRKTAASVKWSPEPWTVGGERSEKQRTPDLSSLIQEVVNQPDWQKGNSLVLIISGSGRRNAQSWDGSWSGAPMLYVEH